jgi:DNA-directed RNA polymerase subunit M/transcription elongation factor TFIIS
MEEPRACPKCQSKDYLFRSRRKVKTDAGEVTETKRRCKACGHEWREITNGGN